MGIELTDMGCDREGTTHTGRGHDGAKIVVAHRTSHGGRCCFRDDKYLSTWG